MITRKLNNLYAEIIERRGVLQVDAEKYAERLFRDMGYKIERRREKGHPDFLLIRGDESYFYVEVKTNGDGLKLEQMEWILKNKDKNVLILYIKQVDEKKELKKIQKKEDKKKEELKEIKNVHKEAMEVLNA